MAAHSVRQNGAPQLSLPVGAPEAASGARQAGRTAPLASRGAILAELRGRGPDGRTCASCAHRRQASHGGDPTCAWHPVGVYGQAPMPMRSSGDPACRWYMGWTP